jgi:hypothetical protein
MSSAVERTAAVAQAFRSLFGRGVALRFGYEIVAACVIKYHR